jgi:hypothetical protein
MKPRTYVEIILGEVVVNIVNTNFGRTAFGFGRRIASAAGSGSSTGV